MQFQMKLGEPVLECSEAESRIGLLTESENKIVGVANDDDLTQCVVLPPRIQPKVQNMVQQHVRQSR